MAALGIEPTNFRANRQLPGQTLGSQGGSGLASSRLCMRFAPFAFFSKTAREKATQLGVEPTLTLPFYKS